MPDRRYMTYGNTAIKYEALPDEPVRRYMGEPAPKQPEREAPDIVRRPEEKQDRRAGDSDRGWVDELKYTCFIGVSVIACLVMCFFLLKANIEYRSEKNMVKQLQNQLTTQQNINEQYSTRLEGAIDLDQIYSIATDELGMVYSEPGQTVYYNKNNEDYAIQYKDVPEAN